MSKKSYIGTMLAMATIAAGIRYNAFSTDGYMPKGSIEEKLSKRTPKAKRKGKK